MRAKINAELRVARARDVQHWTTGKDRLVDRQAEKIEL